MSRSLGPYHTLEELTGRKVVVSDLLHALSKIPRSDVVRCIAVLSAFLERHDSTGSQQQLRMLNELAPPELAKQIRDSLKKLDAPLGTLFHRRQLWFVLQMALLVCKDDSTVNHDDRTRKAVGMCCLMANDLLKAVECEQFIQSEDVNQSLSFVMTALISYTELSFREEVIARAWLFWLDMQEEDAIRKLAKNIGLKQTLEHAFEDVYDIPLREFMLYITSLYVMLLKPRMLALSDCDGSDEHTVPMYDATTLFQSYFSRKHIEKAVALLSATPDRLATRLLGRPRQSWATDSTALARTPLLELAENNYVCPDPHMFRAFFIEGIFELLMGTVNSSQLKQLMGGLFEQYIERLMRSFAPASSVLVNTYFNPVKFKSDDQQEACDGLLLWPSHAVLLECKSSMLTTRQRYAMSLDATTKAIDDQIATFADIGDRKPGARKSRKGIGQLAYNLSRILAGEQVHSKGSPIDLSSVPKLYPAVVVYDEGIANHAVRLHLQIKMIKWFEENGIDHSRVGHVLLFTIRDMEYFELLAHRAGAETIMKDYVQYVEQNPRDPHAMFHEYVLNRYTESHESTGITFETIDRVLKSVKEELERRIELNAQE